MHSIEASILVNAPATECYREWTRYERYPEFMRRVVRVVKLQAQGYPPNELDSPPHENEEIWHFEVKGPFWHTYSLEAVIVQDEPNKVISWSTAETRTQPDLLSSGAVNFLKPAPERHGTPPQTLIHLTMTYSLSSIPLGDFFSDVTMYGDQIVYECLDDFKRYIEARLESEARTEESKRAAIL